ncbi:MAG: LysR family transcriptional regulator [Pseudomonadota bacterium]
MTAAGEWFHRRAGHLCEGMNAIETTLSGQDLRLEGKLTVTTTDSLLHCLTPVAHAFQVRHPDVTLRLLSDAQPLDLAQRDADIALRPTREPPPLWVGRKLHALPCAVYAHQDYWSIVSADAPATQRWILLDDDLHRAPMSQLAQAVKPAEAPSTVINTVMGVYDMVSAGLGLAALPCYLGDRNPALVAVHPGDSRYTWDLWLLAHPDVRRSARVHAFFDFAATAITAEQLATG